MRIVAASKVLRGSFEFRTKSLNFCLVSAGIKLGIDFVELGGRRIPGRADLVGCSGGFGIKSPAKLSLSWFGLSGSCGSPLGAAGRRSSTILLFSTN
jgi:hypothetical protein